MRRFDSDPRLHIEVVGRGEVREFADIGVYGSVYEIERSITNPTLARQQAPRIR